VTRGIPLGSGTFVVPRLARVGIRALSLGWIGFFWIWLIGFQGTFVEVDAQAYWGIRLDDLYRDTQLGDQGAFLYSPLIAWLFLPFSWIPYEVFYAILAAVNLGALVWLLGPELAAISLLLQPVSNEVARGNIHLLMAVAIVAGFRYPGAWAWILLTKVTPAIGLLWFAFRRQWRHLAVALGWTVGLVAISFVAAHDLWIRWVTMLLGNVESTRPSVLEIPVLPRLAIAVLLLALGAWRNRPAIVPIAALLALPAVWTNSLAMLVAVIPLLRRPPGPSSHSDGASTHLD
jgi:hypothetical protein